MYVYKRHLTLCSYTDYIGEESCEVAGCNHLAAFQIAGENRDELENPTLRCEAHLPVMDFSLSGKCDGGCGKRSVEKWLSLVKPKQSKTLYKLCKLCLRKRAKECMIS